MESTNLYNYSLGVYLLSNKEEKSGGLTGNLNCFVCSKMPTID
jgi:hypothetical protein